MAYRYDPYGSTSSGASSINGGSSSYGGAASVLPRRQPHGDAYNYGDDYSNFGGAGGSTTPHTGPMRTTLRTAAPPDRRSTSGATAAFDAAPVDRGWGSLQQRRRSQGQEEHHDDPYQRGSGGRDERDRDDRGGARGPAPGRRADFDKVVDDRLARERPCRTLFIRNIKFGTSERDIRDLFEPIGHIKTFFDMLEKRGMVFLTYYDLRAAMMAKDQLHEKRLAGRPIDVHYGLLKASDLEKKCDPDKNQGSLSLHVAGARGPLDDREIQARFSVFGEIKQVAPSPNGRPNQRVIEFFDSRAMERAYEEMNDQMLAGGKIDLRYDWDLSTTHPGPSVEAPLFRREPPPSSRPRYDDREHGSDRGRDRDRDRDHDRGYGTRSDRRSSREAEPVHRYGGPPPIEPYGPPPTHSNPYGQTTVTAPSAPTAESQLEQARKMQALLASLTANPGVLSSGAPPPPQPFTPGVPLPTGFYLPPPPPLPPNQGAGNGPPPAMTRYSPPAPASTLNPYATSQSNPYHAPPPYSNPYASPPPPTPSHPSASAYALPPGSYNPLAALSSTGGGPPLPPALAALLKNGGGPNATGSASATIHNSPPPANGSGGGAGAGDLSGLLALLAQQHGQQPYQL